MKRTTDGFLLLRLPACRSGHASWRSPQWPCALSGTSAERQFGRPDWWILRHVPAMPGLDGFFHELFDSIYTAKMHLRPWYFGFGDDLAHPYPDILNWTTICWESLVFGVVSRLLTVVFRHNTGCDKFDKKSFNSDVRWQTLYEKTLFLNVWDGMYRINASGSILACQSWHFCPEANCPRQVVGCRVGDQK